MQFYKCTIDGGCSTKYQEENIYREKNISGNIAISNMTFAGKQSIEMKTHTKRNEK